MILLDEIEKAHSDVFNVLLQLLDDGRLTDNQGRTVDFKNTIIIMTSNIESADEEEMKKHFRPEFLNRIDDIVAFSPLTEAQTVKIIDLFMTDIQKRLDKRGITVILTDETKRIIAGEAYSPLYGARPVKRYLQKHIETEIAAKIVKGEVKDGETITIDIKRTI